MTEDRLESAASSDSGPRLGFRARLTLALIAASIIPLAVFAVFVAILEGASVDPPQTRGSPACCCSPP
jgi:hypothetical protein